MHAKKTNKRKLAALLLALALLMGCAAGATLAWLIDTTDPIVNTFTVGNINITLTETGAQNNAKSFKMIPGDDIEKDPTVTVEGGSEACWLFVWLDKSANFDDFMTFTVADGWTKLDGDLSSPGLTGTVYYRKVSTSTDAQSFPVLKDNQVHVKDSVTKEMMTADGFTQPTLKIQAAAIQSDNLPDDALAAAQAFVDQYSIG